MTIFRSQSVLIFLLLTGNLSVSVALLVCCSMNVTYSKSLQSCVTRNRSSCQHRAYHVHLFILSRSISRCLAPSVQRAGTGARFEQLLSCFFAAVPCMHITLSLWTSTSCARGQYRRNSLIEQR